MGLRDDVRVIEQSRAYNDVMEFYNQGLGTSSSFVQDASGYAYDDDSSTLTFSEATASVPFAFSPTLGLLLVGGIVVSSRYIKLCK